MTNVETSEIIDTVHYLKRGTSIIKSMNDYLSEHPETEHINWYKVNALKGCVFGAYLKMDHEGSRLIANSILLAEGIPQRLSGKQQDRLTFWDKAIK